METVGLGLDSCEISRKYSEPNGIELLTICSFNLPATAENLANILPQ